MTGEKTVWQDIVTVAKFTLSCLGLVASGAGFCICCGATFNGVEKLSKAGDLKNPPKC